MIGAWRIDPSWGGGAATNGTACISLTLGNLVHPFTQGTVVGTTTWNVRFSDGTTVVVEAPSVIEARAEAESLARWAPHTWGAPTRHVIGVSEQ